MKKMYVVTMPDGSRYGVPAEIIAANMARYYETKGEPFYINFDAMMHWFDTEDYEFADWAKGNMDWDDVKDAAVPWVRKSSPNCDYQEGWVNGDYQYVVQEEESDA